MGQHFDLTLSSELYFLFPFICNYNIFLKSTLFLIFLLCFWRTLKINQQAFINPLNFKYVFVGKELLFPNIVESLHLMNNIVQAE